MKKVHGTELCLWFSVSITAIPKLPNVPALKGCLVTIDATGWAVGGTSPSG